MKEQIEKKSFLDQIPSFSLVLIMVILIVMGIGLIPLIDIGTTPKARQGKVLSINYWWNKASPKVIEQEVTSKIEGLVSAVNGIKEVSSVSNLGHGYVRLVLKDEVSVSAVRFEISSLLKQIHGKLPEGVTYPQLSGGDVSSGSSVKPTSVNLLTYRINADMNSEQIKEYIDQNVAPILKTIEGVKGVSVSGGTSKYMEITYDPMILSNYGLTAATITDGIKNFMGKSNIVGDLNYVDSDETLRRITLHFSTSKFSKKIGDIPLTTVGDKIIYLNDLAVSEYKNKLPNSYFRVNGLNTIYMNVAVDADANLIALSKSLQSKIDALKPNLKSGVYLTLTHDKSSELQMELEKLVKRTLLSLLILLLFVWIISRSVKYLTIITITLIANLLIAVIIYYLFDIRLHIFSLAGITVSLGIIIDASIVMVDHYSYYRNRKAFLAILGALVTTIGSLVIIFFMPEYIQRDLYDFSRIIIINLTVSLLVALLFVPAIIQRMNFSSRKSIRGIHQSKWLIRWTRFYRKYIIFTQKRKWIYFTLLVLAFGIPFYALPDKLGNDQQYYMSKEKELTWYESAYNDVFNSNFYRTVLKEPIGDIFGGTMRLFSESLGSQTYAQSDKKMVLNIRAQMPLGGSMHHLNDKVEMLEKFLAKYTEIKRFETRVEYWGATVKVEFKDEFEKSGFPYYLESMVIGQILSIGGADWSTSGVNERGFSNSLNLGYRSHRLELVGYNYNRLHKYAEEMCDVLKENKRVTDIVIENKGDRHAVDEFHVDFDWHNITLYNLNLHGGYKALSELLSQNSLGHYSSKLIRTELYLKSVQTDKFDVWNLLNSHIKVDSVDMPFSALGKIEKRKSKNSIEKKNQEYTLTVAYNFLGSYELKDKMSTKVIDTFNQKMPIGYRCLNSTYGWYQDKGTQYWLILLIVVVIFFICSILFESLRQPLVIISLIPVSYIGTFLTFYFSGVNFGTGGFASLVLLSGLVVNAGIYIINEYNNSLKRGNQLETQQANVRMYVKAYNHKIIPVFLTIISTILGLIPFFIDGAKETFWFSFAIGTSGGLLFSVIALVFIMPIFMPLRKQKDKLLSKKR